MRGKRGFTFVEVLVALVVLLIGVIALMKVFPISLRANFESAMKAKAAMLAQMKVEELRRDANNAETFINLIAAQTSPTAPLPFPNDNRLTYSFSGVSLLYPVPDPSNPASTPGVPRVIIRYNAAFRTDALVLYELRFLGP